MCNFSTKLEDLTFDEIKKLLKQEYLSIFIEYVDWSIGEKERIIIERFGKEFFQNQQRLTALKEQIDLTFDAFYKSAEYKTAQETVAKLNQKISTCPENEKKQVEEDIKKALSKIETLKVTIKNRTQKDREELENLKEGVEKIETDNKAEFDEVDKQIESLVIGKLAETVEDYNYILKGLSSIYDVEPPKSKEYPFDEDDLLSCDLSINVQKGVIKFIKSKLQN